jgi:hypothetical protein
MPNDHIKENRFAIITIMLKQMAIELREKWPHLHIKAHPMAWSANRARLVVRDKNTRVIFDIRQGTFHDWRKPKPTREDPNEYNISVMVTEGNDVSRKKTPPAWTFSLDDPNSTIEVEKWVDTVVKQWINVGPPEQQPEAECPVDSDGSAEV